MYLILAKLIFYLQKISLNNDIVICPLFNKVRNRIKFTLNCVTGDTKLIGYTQIKINYYVWAPALPYSDLIFHME